jgi:c-di-GMP-binding flagellar brake protein YcgR
MSWDGSYNRRKHKRVNLKLLMEFYDPDAANNEQQIEMETLNFSAGGFYCNLKKKMLPLTRLSLGFVFPPFGPDHEGEREVQCEAVVVRCDEDPDENDRYRMAACFINLSNTDRDYVEEYLEWYDTVYGWGEMEYGDDMAQEDEEVA